MVELLDELQRSVAEQLVPEPYEAYRPVVLEALRFFLERLSPDRRNAIVGEQLALPSTTRASERLVVLLRQCPTLHKLGQVVAHDGRLAQELRERLQSLESLAPTTDLGEIMPIIQREAGRLADVVIANDALAEGSVAIVVPFVWNAPDPGMPPHGVFKVIKPRAEERLLEELEVWPAVGEFLEERCAQYGLPMLEYRTALESVRKLLLNEIRLDGEQAHLAQAAAFYADSPDVIVPRLLPFCAAHVTAMERVDGAKVTASELTPSVRRRLAETMIEALLAKPFWSATQSVPVHADPHAGNLFVTGDGRLAILDWALVTELTSAQRAAVVQAVLGALTLDEAHVVRSIASLARISDRRALDAAVIDAVRQVRQGTFPGFAWLTALLDRAVTVGAMQFPEELLLFRKALLTLMAIVREVCEAVGLDSVFARSATLQFLRELPGRALAPPESRVFGSHVSNWDLMRMWSALPVLPARFWIESWRDALAAL